MPHARFFAYRGIIIAVIVVVASIIIIFASDVLTIDNVFRVVINASLFCRVESTVIAALLSFRTEYRGSAASND